MKIKINQKYEPMVRKFGEYLSTSYSNSTVKDYLTAIRELLDGADKFPEDLTFNDVKAYVKHIRANDKFYSKRNKFASLKLFMAYMKLKGINDIYDEWGNEKKLMGIDIFKIKRTEKPRNKKETLTKDEVKKIFNYTRKYPRDHAICKAFYYTTQRGGTIQNLNIDDIENEPFINPKDGKPYHIVHIEKAKLGETYDLEIEPECIEAIMRYFNEFREEPDEGYIIDNYGRKLLHKDAVFLNGTGQRLMEQSMNKMMKKIGVACGINKRIYCHLWRASAISIMYADGVPPADIIKRTGHTSIRSLEPYINLDEDLSTAKCSHSLSLENDSTFTPKTNLNQRALMEELIKENEKLKNRLRDLETGYQ